MGKDRRRDTDGQGYSLTLDGTGNVYACGSYFGTAAFADTSITSMVIILMHSLLSMIHPANLKWIREAKSISQTQYNCIKVDGNKNVLAVGYFGCRIFKYCRSRFSNFNFIR